MTKREPNARQEPSLGCDRARRFIVEGTESPDQERELGEHLGACSACACLAADGGALARELSRDGGELELGGMLADLERSLARERSPIGRLRSLPTRVRALLAASAATVLVLVAGVLRARADLEVYPALRLGLELGALSVTAALSVWLWLRPLFRPPLPSWLVPAVAAIALVLPWLVAGAPRAHAAHPASLAGAGDDLAARALACLVYGGLTGALLLLLLAALGRAPAARAPFTALAALAGALVGVAALQLHCPITQPVHLLLGHAPLPLLLAALLVGAAAARRRAVAGSPR